MRYRTNSKGESHTSWSRAGARHLFDCWPRVAHDLNSAKRVALFLDFDGTLVPLRNRPSDVKPLGLRLRKVLRRLAGCKRLSVYVISGRRRLELRKLVPVPQVRLLGLYGSEGRTRLLLNAERRLLRQAKRRLARCLPNNPQIRVEDKGLGLAVHYRGAPSRVVRRALPAVAEVVRDFRPQLRILQGHQVWELLPRQIEGKGAAVRQLLSKLPARALPIFVGDDASDESGFGAVPHGLTVRVGKKRRTKARFRLRSPAEVEAFLLKLESEIA